MTKNIAIIGMGKWGNHLLGILEKMEEFNVMLVLCKKTEDVKVKTSAVITSWSKDLHAMIDCGEINGVIITTQAEKHFETIKSYIGKTKFFIEKPLCTTKEDLKKFKRLNEKDIMVGNKFLHSHAIMILKHFFIDNGVIIDSISSKWLKNCKAPECGIFFDLHYHHIYLMNLFMGEEFKSTQYFCLNKNGNIPSAGMSILTYYKKYPKICCIESSYNNLEDFHTHEMRIETCGHGTFIIKEENRKIIIYRNGEIFFKEGCEINTRNEMKAFHDFLEKHTGSIYPLNLKSNIRITENLLGWK